MDLWDVLKLMVRRWYATVPLLLASLASAVWIGVASEPDYVATSNVTLLPPTAREDPNSKRSVNPWTVDSLMGAVVTRLNSKTEHDKLDAEGHSPIWVASTDYNYRQQLVLEVTASSAAEASATTKRLHEIALAEVAMKQAGYQLRPGEEITAVPFDQGENVVTESKKIYRLMIVIAGAGVILTMGSAIALDAWLRWRSSRKARAKDTAPKPDGQGIGRVGSSPPAQFKASSGPIKAGTPRPTDDDTVIVRSAPHAGGIFPNGGTGETASLLSKKNGEVASAVATEYRVATAESAPPSGPRAGAQAGEVRTEPADATVVLPLSNAARAARDEQKKL